LLLVFFSSVLALWSRVALIQIAVSPAQSILLFCSPRHTKA
jgi:hypothetical protein